MENDRGDSFPFDFEPNGTQLGSVGNLPVQYSFNWKGKGNRSIRHTIYFHLFFLRKVGDKLLGSTRGDGNQVSASSFSLEFIDKITYIFRM